MDSALYGIYALVLLCQKTRIFAMLTRSFPATTTTSV